MKKKVPVKILERTQECLENGVQTGNPNDRYRSYTEDTMEKI